MKVIKQETRKEIVKANSPWGYVAGEPEYLEREVENTYTTVVLDEEEFRKLGEILMLYDFQYEQFYKKFFIKEKCYTRIKIEFTHCSEEYTQEVQDRLLQFGISTKKYITKNFGEWYHLDSKVIIVNDYVLNEIRAILSKHCSFRWEHKENKVLVFKYTV